MGERKVLNKYYPPDFDAAKIPKRRRPKQERVRNMHSMSVRCQTCGSYIYKGTKYNGRKEEVIGETYLGEPIYRFYTKCTWCSAEIVIKTDPQNSDYLVEAGARRNFEPWRAKDEEADGAKRKRENEEMGDAMKSLENRTMDSKREMDILAALEELKSIKFPQSRQANVSVDVMLEALQRTAKEKKLEEEDEALVKSLFGRPREVIHRIDDDVFYDDESSNYVKRRKVSEELASNPTDYLAKTSDNSKNEEKQDDGKFIFKSPSARVSAVRKQTSASGQVKYPKAANVLSTRQLSFCH